MAVKDEEGEQTAVDFLEHAVDDLGPGLAQHPVLRPAVRRQPRGVRGRLSAMHVRFWGTRGSLPVSLTAADIKHKIVESLMAAAGRSFRTREDAQSFVEKELPFSVSHTYGGNSSCVELDVGSGEYILCDVGTGARP